MGVLINMKLEYKSLEGMMKSIENIPGSFDKGLEKAAIYMMGVTGRRFEKQVNPWGAKWKALSETTIAMRRGGSGLAHQANAGAMILQDTGRLKASVTAGKSPDTIKKFSGSGIERRLLWGTNVEYAHRHQFGIRVPKRVFLGINSKGSPSDEETIHNIIADTVWEDVMRKKGKI